MVGLDDTLETVCSGISSRFKSLSDSDIAAQLHFAEEVVLKEFNHDHKIQDVLNKHGAKVDSSSQAVLFTLSNTSVSCVHEIATKNKELIIKSDLGKVIESLTVTYQGVERPIQIKSYPDLFSLKSLTHSNSWSDIKTLNLRGTFWSEELLNSQHQAYSLFGFKTSNSDTKVADSYFWNRQVQKFVNLDNKH